MAKHVKRSTIPIYLVGVVWLVFGLFLSLSQPMDYVLCAVISIAAFVVGKAIFPDKHYQMPGQEEPKQEKKEEQEAKKEPEPQKPEAPKSTGNPEIDNLIKERERALSEMRRLNDSIEDETISAQIDHLEEITSKIIDQVIKEPSKLPQIRRFLNYYLPTTLKILNAYDRMDAAGVSGDNIDSTKQRVERMMGTIVKAFDKQLDALFGAEAMDISTDITVMENLLAQEGLAGEGKTTTKSQGSDVTLEL
ncbi:5-bromo-4-chloroindolyl phosphate hydrolysis family protein [Pseudoflavonifractor phocaeensis]|uniref:5-bromo-4-chloroindolyl phosphate hydrolysis family protein n=1 Tax=Pseudoflavonifractor phocaeensis TaxID=1870988 RepID=UPI0025A42812|nr:5-bromo-4-chloroindolyl phosphate hydrolysis family protein [Pseudoflavonifractor phocaeensis]MDM8240056.1 5-bromo-4-chloroindolyl phosphate hydrolysis family protein [Pseudoflavonifractor phocaeensis]